LLIIGGNEKNCTLVRVLTNTIIELKKLQEALYRLQKLQEFNNGIEHYGVNKIIQKISSIFVIMWFPMGNKSYLRKFTEKWFRPYIV
jgi:hypothetical protein